MTGFKGFDRRLVQGVKVGVLSPLLAFAIPLAVRAIPEALMGPYPTGFDTIAYYVPNVYDWMRYGVDWWQFMAIAPLFYCILLPARILGFQVVPTLKLVSPVLHGFLGFAIYMYARKGLDWSRWKSLLASLLATLYFTALRVSWDMLRLQLGLILLFAFLTLFQSVLKGKGLGSHLFFSLFAALTVLAHQLLAVIMFACVAVFMLGKLKRIYAREMVKTIVSMTPSALIFLFMLYAVEFRVFTGYPKWEPGGWLSLFGFQSYWDMATNTVGFLAYCYLPLLPAVLLGLTRLKSLELRVWTLLCLGFVLFPLLSPSLKIGVWEYRWTLLLGYPLAFYVVDGLAKFKPNPWTLRRLLAYVALVVVFASFLGYLSTGFLVMTPEGPIPYFDAAKYNDYIYYMQSSMLQNTISVNDCRDADGALEWIKGEMGSEACLLTHTAFRGQALLKLGEERIIHYGYGDPEEAAREALEQGYAHVYLIWWIRGGGWHGQSIVPEVFREVYRSGRIAVYLYGAEP